MSQYGGEGGRSGVVGNMSGDSDMRNTVFLVPGEQALSAPTFAPIFMSEFIDMSQAQQNEIVANLQHLFSRS